MRYVFIASRYTIYTCIYSSLPSGKEVLVVVTSNSSAADGVGGRARLEIARTREFVSYRDKVEA